MILYVIINLYLHARVVIMNQENSQTENIIKPSCELFIENLTSYINNYNGEYKDIISYCPELLKLLCNISNDPLLDWYNQIRINAALAYLILPDDIYPDFKEKGYIDDIFIICYVLKEIRDSGCGNLLINNWEGTEDILILLDTLYNKSINVVYKEQLDILHKVGLYKFQLMITEYSNDYREKISKLSHEKKELLGLISFLIKEFYDINVDRHSKNDRIISVLKQYGDYNEIMRIIEISKASDIYLPKLKDKTNNSDDEDDMTTKLMKARTAVLMSKNRL